MARYCKRPVEIEAIQLNWKNWGDVCDFLGDTISPSNPGRSVDGFTDSCEEVAPYIELTVTTIHGEEAVIRHGDWIVREPAPGRFYPIKPDIFDKTYEAVQ